PCAESNLRRTNRDYISRIQLGRLHRLAVKASAISRIQVFDDIPLLALADYRVKPAGLRIGNNQQIIGVSADGDRLATHRHFLRALLSYQTQERLVHSPNLSDLIGMVQATCATGGLSASAVVAATKDTGSK